MKSNEKIHEVFNKLLERYGSQYWWPAESWFEVMIGAVLTQSTSWANVEKAITNLKEADKLSPSAIREIGLEELSALIRPSGFHNAKARKLKALAEFIDSRFNDDLEQMKNESMDSIRNEFLGVHGIGQETADAILLYALNKPSFVIDAYSKRLFSRLGLAPEQGAYSFYRTMFMECLQPDASLFNEYHALIVRHGKDSCRKRPVCNECCLLKLCPTGLATLSS